LFLILESIVLWNLFLEPISSIRERSKAQKYREMANKVMNKTPFVGKMLNNMAEKYERDAEWWNEDHRVKKRLGRW